MLEMTFAKRNYNVEIYGFGESVIVNISPLNMDPMGFYCMRHFVDDDKAADFIEELLGE